MANSKGIGIAPIVAVAIVSTVVTIFLDRLGITTKVQAVVERMF